MLVEIALLHSGQIGETHPVLQMKDSLKAAATSALAFQPGSFVICVTVNCMLPAREGRGESEKGASKKRNN